MKDHRWYAVGAACRSGHESVGIGIFYWHPAVAVDFLGPSLPKSYCVQGAGVGVARLLKRPVLVDRLTVLPVLRPGSS